MGLDGNKKSAPKGCTLFVWGQTIEDFSLQILSDRRRLLREQLELLWELQKIDLELKSIKEEKDQYPKEMKKLDEKQKIEKERIQKEKERVESLEKTRRQKEGHLNLEQEKIKRAEGRMSEVKTNKEYQALLSEIDAIKEANSRLEEEILQVLDEIDELKKDLSKREKEVGTTLEKIETERKKLQEKMTHDERVWNEQMERREVLSKEIESKLVKLYNTLKEKRQGVGVVNVKNETCQGCFVNVPPQMFIEVQKNNALIRCPNCNRILYWDRDRNKK
jgi:predicted  nucleic acid-binding Zn-ribbon protein